LLEIVFKIYLNSIEINGPPNPAAAGLDLVWRIRPEKLAGVCLRSHGPPGAAVGYIRNTP